MLSIYTYRDPDNSRFSFVTQVLKDLIGHKNRKKHLRMPMNNYGSQSIDFLDRKKTEKLFPKFANHFVPLFCYYHTVPFRR